MTLVVAILLTLAKVASAQPLNMPCIEGMVRFSDGRPAPFALVQLSSPALAGSRVIVADARGAFTIGNVPAATVSLIAPACPQPPSSEQVRFRAAPGERHWVELVLPHNSLIRDRLAVGWRVHDEPIRCVSAATEDLIVHFQPFPDSKVE